MLSNLSVTLNASLAIMLSATYVLWLNIDVPWLPYWTMASLVMAILRARMLARFRAQTITVENSDYILRSFRRGALVTGTLWGVLPLMLSVHTNTMIGGFMIFIIAGVSAGAMIQSTCYAPLAISFVLPAISGAALSLFMNGTATSIIIGGNTILLGFMMVRASRRAEREYWDSQWVRLEATALAKSLKTANLDVTAANEQLSKLANHDVMTGLPNRASFNDNLRRLLASARHAKTDLALIVLDLDNFKIINDTQGHGAGDNVIAEAARRLDALRRSVDVVARLGGDEFAVIVPGPNARAEATRLAGDLIQRLSLPIALGERSANVGASVGIAVFPDDATTAEDLFSSSDIALYEAKAKGRRRAAQFDSRLKEQLELRRRLESDLGNALFQRELDVSFQPQFDLSSRRIVGYEALIRWTHPTLGPISPPEIISASQLTHQSDRLTAYVIEASCDFIERMAALGHDDFSVAINISPVEFLTHSPSELILGCLRRRGIAPWRLEVEITEEAILDARAADTDLRRLEDAGVRIAIDDFGAGHSSLAHIVGLKIDRIKIDRTFVTGLDTNIRHQALVQAILSLSKTLGIEVLAEGIETEAECETLVRLGCRVGQGFLVAPAMVPPVLTKWLTKYIETNISNSDLIARKQSA
ncbi:putative bifunctional diguanylate cyclase/phosphodiesterase [Oryzibacter oryziterrae]|uniref:putative bifunctional diguanylate cyclase/phosphodiesterase n=1 Tax=Oryzibacter oryziterrae TaxID=2766474 RepID=UPI001F314DF9|nr:EAL domain-containing protein [Oryzibacter oryziterrae]